MLTPDTPARAASVMIQRGRKEQQQMIYLSPSAEPDDDQRIRGQRLGTGRIELDDRVKPNAEPARQTPSLAQRNTHPANAEARKPQAHA